MKSSPLRIAVVAFLFLLTSTGTIRGEWMETWTGPTNPDQSWTFLGLLSDGPTSGFSNGIVSSGVYELRVDGPVGSVPTGGAASVAGWVSESFSDATGGLRMQAVINPNNAFQAENIGVLAYFDPGTLSGYAATINFDADLLDINVITSGAQTLLAQGSIPGSFSETDTFTLEFLLDSGALTGRVYDSLSNPPLLQVTAADTTYSSGLGGILAQRPPVANNLLGTFGPVTATTAVPEPSAGLLAAAGVISIGCLGIKRLCRKKAGCAGRKQAVQANARGLWGG